MQISNKKFSSFRFFHEYQLLRQNQAGLPFCISPKRCIFSQSLKVIDTYIALENYGVFDENQLSGKNAKKKATTTAIFKSTAMSLKLPLPLQGLAGVVQLSRPHVTMSGKNREYLWHRTKEATKALMCEFRTNLRSVSDFLSLLSRLTPGRV